MILDRLVAGMTADEIATEYPIGDHRRSPCGRRLRRGAHEELKSGIVSALTLGSGILSPLMLGVGPE